jgi:hypothetical protein
MSPLEDQLRSALRRKDPPAGFAVRVMEKTVEKVEKEAENMVAGASRWRQWWPATAVFATLAAAVAVVSIVAPVYQRQREERAGRQAVAALQIAAEKLNFVRDQAFRLDQPGNAVQKDLP